MIQQTIKTIQDSINLHLNQNMQIQNNQYGARVGLDYKDQWLTLKVPNKITDPVKGVLLEYVNGQSGKAEWRDINPQNFGRFFDTNNYTYSDFLNDLKNGIKSVVAVYVKEANAKTEASMAIESANNSDIQYRTKTFNLFSTGQFSNQYTNADKEFIYNRVFRDKWKNYYFLLENQLWPLEFKNNTERVVQGNGMDSETNFWPAFFRTFSSQIDVWNQTIVKSLITYDPANIGKSIEEYLMDMDIPRIYMECLVLVKTERGEISYDDKGKGSLTWYPEKIDVQLDTGTSNHSWSYANQVSVFSKTLFQSLDADRVSVIPTFSNDPNEIAVKHLPSFLPRKCEKTPKLPPHWEKFLGGDRFFDPIMDKMKIACFVHNTYKANYSDRQVMILGGEGDDGKGTFIKVLETILSEKYAVTCKPNDFVTDNRFALTKIFNKKLVVLPDCKYISKLFGYDQFKQLTGGDSLDLDRKFSTPIKYVPAGVTVIIGTNNPFYILGEHGKSRVIPIVFRKNFKWNTFVEKNQMISDLLSEKDKFLQWCEDYRMYVNSKCKGTLLRGDRLRLCADSDLKAFIEEDWNTEEAQNKEYEYFKNSCRNQTLGGTIFCSWNQRLDEDAAKVEDLEEAFDVCLTDLITNCSKFSPELSKQLNLVKDGDRVYMSMNSFISYINETFMTRGTKFYSYMESLIDTRIGIKNHPKNDACIALRTWLEDHGCVYHEKPTLDGHIHRKTFDITNFSGDKSYVDTELEDFSTIKDKFLSPANVDKEEFFNNLK